MIIVSLIGFVFFVVWFIVKIIELIIKRNRPVDKHGEVIRYRWQRHQVKADHQ